MFEIPEAMHSYWENKDYRKITADELSKIESVFGGRLPASYIDFTNRYGFVVFDDVPGMLRHFDYTVVPSPENRFAEKGEIGRGDIAFLYEPAQIVKAYKICTSRQAFEDEEDEIFPKFPHNYLPIGSDVGQGTILMETTERPGRIWYWYENDWAWGLEDNTWLGFVAEDFESFINGLKP